MKVRVLFFAVLREKAGCRETTVELPPGTSIAALWDLLCRSHPAIAPMTGSVSFALDQEYVEPGTELTDDAEVALIPPVSGG